MPMTPDPREPAPAGDQTRWGAGTPAVPADTLVTFELGAQTLGVDVAHVREILDRQPVLHLPHAGTHCAGMIDSRGQTIPLIDLAARLGLAASGTDDHTRIIVFDLPSGGGTRPIGIMADRVLDVARIERTEIEPAPALARSPQDGIAVRGLARCDGRLIILIDIVRMLCAEDGS